MLMQHRSRSDRGCCDDNAIAYAQRINADSVGASTRGDGHFCSVLCYVLRRPERASRRRGWCSMLSSVVHVGMLRFLLIDRRDHICIASIRYISQAVRG